MVVFSSNGDASNFKTYYGIGTVKPEADDNMATCYTTSMEANGDFMDFTVTRDLECAEKDKTGGSYVVALDTELSLIASWNPNNPELSFHMNHYLEFKQTINSDGTCEGVTAASSKEDEDVFSDQITQWITDNFGQIVQ